MTSPVTTAAARPAAPAAAPAGAGDSAEPFATALDGVMAAGGDVDGAGADGEQPEQEAPDGAVPPPVADLPPAPAGGPIAALWARFTGTAGGPRPTTGEIPAVPGDAAGAPRATGRAHALEVTAGLAHGLRALPGEQGPAGGLALGTGEGKPGTGTVAPAAPSPAAPSPATPGAPAPAAPGGGTPVPSPTATADAVAALAAAGVQVVVAGPTDGRGPALAPSPLAGAPAPLPAADVGDTAAPAGPPTVGTAPAVVAPASGAPFGGGDGAPAEQRQPGDAPDGAAPVTGGTGAPAPSAVAAAPRAEAATGAAVAQPVAGQLARSVAVLRGGPDGTHTMTVVLAPEALGPVEVTVRLSEGTVELTLRGAHDHGRAALVDALPDLRRDLEAAGLTCSRVDVDRGGRDGSWSGQQSSASSQTGGREGGGRDQQQRGDTGARPWHRTADNEEGHPARTHTASGLDVRV